MQEGVLSNGSVLVADVISRSETHESVGNKVLRKEQVLAETIDGTGN